MKRKMNCHRSLRAFTLIELLIVVAIIAILAAIAVPNFVEAQTRSKVSRAKADMRSMATAIETYQVDNNDYPIVAGEDGSEIMPYPLAGPEAFETRVSRALTTPIAYVTTRFREPFPAMSAGNPEDQQFHYSTLAYLVAHEGDGEEWFEYLESMLGGGAPSSIQYFLLSHGPDLDHDGPEHHDDHEHEDEEHGHDHDESGGPVLYDPTNGTVSNGDIVYWGPGVGYRN